MMNDSSGKDGPDIEQAKEKLLKNREKILRDADKIGSGLESLAREKKLKASQNKNKA